MSSKGSLSLRSGALTGFADGSSYDKHRPSYPSEAISLLLQQLGVSEKQHARIVDLAAGTGKFTELLASRSESYEVTAIEPHDGMRVELDHKVLQGVTVLNGYADDIPLPDHSAEALICAQSFHWFSNITALTSIARVLQPQAKLGLIWNVEDYNNTLDHRSPHPWTLKLRQLLFDLDAKSPSDTPALRFRNETWRQVFKAENCPFQQTQEQEFAWFTSLDRDALWSRFRTLSQVAVLTGQDLESARKLFDEALNGDGTEYDDNGRIVVRGNTLVVWAAQQASKQ